MNEDYEGVVKQHLRRARETEDYQAARTELEAALKALDDVQAPRHRDLELGVWMDYAIIADRFGDLKTALDLNERLAAAAPDRPYPQLALARSYSKIGEIRKAADSLARCQDLAERAGDGLILAMLAAKGELPQEGDARTRRLADAVARLREELASVAGRVAPEAHAAIQAMLGNLCRQEAERVIGKERPRKLGEAAAAFREALGVYTPEDFPEKNRAVVEALEEIERLLRGTT